MREHSQRSEWSHIRNGGEPLKVQMGKWGREAG